MRRWFIAAFVANLAVAAMSLAVLPERVAIHFGAGGLPDNWASKETHALLFAAILVLMFLLFLDMGRLTLKFPARWISVPHRDYWLSETRRGEFVARFNALMHEFGAAVFAFLLCVQLLTLDANLNQPVRLDETLFLVALAVFFLYVAAWLVRLFRRLRPPAASS